MAKAKIVEVSEEISNEFLRIRKARVKLPSEVSRQKVKKKKIDRDLIPRKPKPPMRPYNEKAQPVKKKGKIIFALIDAVRHAQHSPAEALAQIKTKRLRRVKPGNLVKLGVDTANVIETFWAEIRKKGRNGQIEASIQEPMFHKYMHGLDQGSRIRFAMKNVMDVAVPSVKVIDRKIYRIGE
jgi:hypothetical protein